MGECKKDGVASRDVHGMAQEGGGHLAGIYMGGCKKEGVASRDVHGRVQERGSS